MPRPTGRPAAKGWVRRLWPHLRPSRRSLVLSFIGAGAAMGVTAVNPLLYRTIVDDAVSTGRPSVLPWVGLVLGLGVVRYGATWLRRHYAGLASFDTQQQIRDSLFAHLQTLDAGTHERLRAGQLVSRASADLSLLQQFLSMLPQVSSNVLLLVTSVTVMLVLSWPLGLVALVTVPASVAITLRIRRSVFAAAWAAAQREAELTGAIEEAISGVRVVKGFGQEPAEVARISDSAATMYGARLQAVRLRATFSAALQSVPAVGQVAVLLLGGWLAVHHRISVGTFLAFTTYLVQLASPARMIGSVVALAQQARASVERTVELLDTAATVVDRPGAYDLPAGPGAVRFEQVSFAYAEGSPVLDEVTFEVPAGAVVAVVGASGSGKSTLGLLLARIHDVSSGRILIDGTDIAQATLGSLRQRVGVAFEETFLFSDTVRANIAYGRPDATDDEVEAAARAAQADGFIRELPDGYDTVVGERGLTLSGGQRQRIALARLLLADPAIAVLDDALSAVDAAVEAAAHDALRDWHAGRTMLVIAHRASTARLADRVVMLVDGRVAAIGTHDELVETHPGYRELIESADDGGSEASAAEAVLAPPPPVPARVPAAAVRRPGGTRTGGGRGSWVGLMAPNPDLLARVEALGPPRDVLPEGTTAAAAADEGRLSLRATLHPHRAVLAVGLALVLADALATLAGPWLIRLGVDRGITHRSLHALVVISAAFAAVTLFDWWDMWAETVVTGKAAERMLAALRVRIFAHLQRLALDFYERELAGRLLTRVTSDVDTLSQLLQNGLVNAVVALATLVGIAVILLVTDVELALVALAVLPLIVAATVRYQRRSAVAYDRQRDRIAAVNAAFAEGMAGVQVVQVHRQERRTAAAFARLDKANRDAGMTALHVQISYVALIELLQAVATGLVLLVGTELIRSAAVTSGVLIAFLLYLTQLFSPIQQLSQVFDSYQRARAGMRKIAGLLATRTSTPVAARPLRPAALDGALRFDGVSFRYAGAQRDAVHGIDLAIPAGERVALVGATGAGKSTLMKLAARFYDPTCGRVLVDGHDLRELDLTGYRQRLGYVPQEPFLFSGTIRHNIAYGRPEATDDEVRRVAVAVGADPFVRHLPHGYDTEVSERGRSLSAGQRQLICLARALLVDPAILLLDEATATVDLVAEAVVTRAIATVTAGRTTLIIAHRLQTALHADRIVVVDGGRIVEDGTHGELLALGGVYAAMWAIYGSARSAA